jgi:RNA polymerase sigma-70 factor (ECF subfamily)
MSHRNLPNNDARPHEYLRLLAQYDLRLRGFVFTLVPNWADAEDIVQEVKLRLWEQFDDYDPTKDFWAWTCAIARYQVLTHREKQSRRRQVISLETLNLIADDFVAISEAIEGRQQALADCFAKLPEPKRTLLMSYYSGKETMRELAARLGQTFYATRHTIVRTRIALRKCVENALRQEDRP